MAKDGSSALKLKPTSTGIPSYSPLEIVSLKNDPYLSEAWLQDRIAENPEILGLGEVVLMQRERMQPRAGRLDLLLRDPDGSRRYTVEIQLGSLDESHIIRTIEYWESERRRYPNIEHCAVICAEEITGRFLNVISLFNGHIPLIALQVKAVKFENKVGLFFTKVLDEVQLGVAEETEERQEVSRATWEQRSSKESIEAVDRLSDKIKIQVGIFDLKYNKHSIGCSFNGRAANFINFKPQRSSLRMDLNIKKLTSEQIEKLESADIEVLPYASHWRVHPIRLNKNQVENPPREFFDIIKFAFDEYFGD